MQDLVSESLHIVGEELAVTLNDVRAALEQYADGGAGPQMMDRCLDLLHTANGVLRLTQTYGAGLLAEEMEGTCHHLGKLRAKDGGASEAIEALSRAAVQLPAYVERIINGGRDIPLVLLPLLNDLRAARGKALLSESTLLLLNVGEPSASRGQIDGRKVSGEDVVHLCKVSRSAFQLALLGWIKGSNDEKNLRKLGKITERLENASTTREVHQLWWVTGGVVEALLGGGLETSVSLKRLMGQTDREMKRLTTVTESHYAEQAPTELVNNLLYYIARSKSRGPRVSAIRAAFNLSELVPGDDQIEAVRESLAAPSARLMQTVAQAIRDDLARVKDVLDIYVRTGMEHIEELLPQVELLKKISDTMGVLGLGELREIIQTKRDELQTVIDEPGQADEAILVDMAAALLHVEDRLDEQLFGLIRPPEESVEGATAAAAPPPQDSEYQQVIQAVMRESIVNLARVKDAVSQVLERPGEAAVVDSVPQQLHGITAGLLLLEKDTAVGVVERIGGAIGGLIVRGDGQPDANQVDLLADAMVSLEYYMETLQAGRKEPEYMLDNAVRCLDALDDTGYERVPQFADEQVVGGATTMEIAAYEPTLVVVDTQHIAAPPVLAGDRETIDPEILELFIEEAGEEIDSIQSHFPAWEQDDSAEEVLITVRRSFHTLKGSGRMVGAELIGEFSWNIEDLLNRVINKTLERSVEMVQFLRESIDALPQLLEQLEVGTEPASDFPLLMRKAVAFANGDVPSAVHARAAQAESDEVEDQTAVLKLAAEAGDADDAMDPVLLEILTNEASTHLSVLKSFVEDCVSASAPYPVTEEVYRACHTLHGSVTMANAEPAAKITHPLNQLFRSAYDHELAVADEIIAASTDSIDAMELIVECLADPVRELPDTSELESKLVELNRGIEDEIARAETESRAEETIMPGLSEVADRPPAETGEDLAADTVGFDPEIAEIFSEEAAEILESADHALAQFSAGQNNEPAYNELQRCLHTLKGGARMAGLAPMGDLSHDLETLVIRVSGDPVDSAMLALFQSTIDELHRMAEGVADGVNPAAPSDLVASLSGALDGAPMEPEKTAKPEEPVAKAVADKHEEEEVLAEPDEPEPEEAADEADEAEPPAMPEHMPVLDELGKLARDLQGPATPESRDLANLIQPAPVDLLTPERRDAARVDPAVLEHLLNAAGEISIFHSRVSQQMTQIQFNLDELGQTVVRLRDQLRALEMATEAQILYQHQSEISEQGEFDPLQMDRYSKIQQLSRALAETATDVNSLKDLLQSLTGETEALLVQQSRTAAELQDGLMRTRMVPFQQHSARLARLVRQIAAEHDKQAELALQGSGEIDRQVLEKMLPPFEHMLRNAVIHGIETPKERKKAGKPADGRISINLHREGSEIVIEIKDDGRGLDVKRIRKKARELGYIEKNAKVTDEEAMQFVLRSGFSTADQLTQAAGRGIGMDVVANEIARLGGTLRIESEPGKGTAFIVRLPFTLAVTQALIVRAATELYAMPLPSVEGIIRIPRAEFDAAMETEEPAIEYGGQAYEYRHLGQYLGLGRSRIPPEQDRVPVVLVRAGNNSTALITDEMLDSREIVVKPIGEQLTAIRGVSGATILSDGRIVVILDAGGLVRSIKPALDSEDIAAEAVVQQPLALVVDDSITMRRVTQRLLERNGMRVITAKDGIEAISVLQEHIPDIILLDIEMPRMDGYEFATHVRNNSGTEEVPIIMITSRVSDKHRARAIELGVNDYLGKPYQERALWEAVQHLLNPA